MLSFTAMYFAEGKEEKIKWINTDISLVNIFLPLERFTLFNVTTINF